MTFTTNVAKAVDQSVTIAEVIKGRIGDVMLTNTHYSLTTLLSEWINYMDAVDASERISTKQIVTTKGSVRLTHNEGNGNIKIQIKKKSANVPA